MKSALAVLTFRRRPVLETFLESLRPHCGDLPLAIFEDCGQVDDTDVFLARGRRFKERSMAYEADRYVPGPGGWGEVFLGLRNLGVSGNSNRALRWFAEETDADHLLLCNDDLLCTGPFHEDYALAHEHHEVGLFCFSDFTEAEIPRMRLGTISHRGQDLRTVGRMTGIMMSLTRAVVETIGYFDDRFVFGEEHCEYTNRARLAGFMRLSNRDQYCLDVPTKYLTHQTVMSSVRQAERTDLDAEAAKMIQRAGSSLRHMCMYRPYSIACRLPEAFGYRFEFGIPMDMVRDKWPLIVTRCPDPNEAEVLPLRS